VPRDGVTGDVVRDLLELASVVCARGRLSLGVMRVGGERVVFVVMIVLHVDGAFASVLLCSVGDFSFSTCVRPFRGGVLFPLKRGSCRLKSVVVSRVEVNP